MRQRSDGVRTTWSRRAPDCAERGDSDTKGSDQRIRSVTFFATQVDFSEPGDLQVFIDEQQLANLDKMMEEKGYLEGQAMFTTFNMLRANDLFWSFYVNNYLLGKDPAPFDLLYWNADATRMPRGTHMFYLREMYLKNNLGDLSCFEMR